MGYIRVSTDQQADEGVSLAAQEAKQRAFAIARDSELVGVEVDALSGKNTQRPALKRALRMLEEGKADGLLVTKLDRLTRNVRDLGDLLDTYFTNRFTLLSVGDSIDTRTAGGRLTLNIIASVSQWEREAIAERTRDALAHLRATGGGTPRTEGRALERITQCSARGMSLREIAGALEREGIPTLKGGRWAPETIRKVLARR